MPSIELKRRVRWADADPAFRINFPRYFEYFEEGEAELLRSRGFSLLKSDSEYGFPRVHAECSFKRTLAIEVWWSYDRPESRCRTRMEPI